MKLFQTVCFIFLLMQLNAQKLSSPDKRLVFAFTLTHQSPLYEVYFNKKKLVNKSPLTLEFFKEGKFSANLKAAKPVFTSGDEIYDLVVGKAKTVHSQYNQMIISLTSTQNKKQINLVARAFNDGIAFRYEFPKQNGWIDYALTEEGTTFNLAQNPTVLTLFRENYVTSHEGFYNSLPLAKVKNDTLMDLPTLFQYSGNIFMAITEANLRDYASMYLIKKDGLLQTALSPLPDQTAIKVKAILPHHTPWRVMMISDTIGKLIESNILTNLCEPNIIKDVSWIKPGKSTFPWWNGTIVPDTTWPGGNNFETNKYYIDFCAANKIDYHSIVEYGLHEWYVNDGASFMPGLNVDATKAVAGLDMKAICDYAKNMGVMIRVWVHWKALYPKLEAAFTQYEQWGLKGLMMDFMDRDDQEMVNIYEEVLRSAAKHHLHLQFHGAFKPSGLHRTFPNEFTREATYNYENNKWNSEGLSPDHDINMPFTRMLAGATDYHLGGFRAVPPEKFKTQQSRPLMIGTRCHMLGMYVVLESYLGMVCDYPDAYIGQPGFEFIKEVPTSWDETKVIDAKVGGYIVIARRKGNDWFVGSINNNEERIIEIPFDFLSAGQYKASIFTDAWDVLRYPDHLNKKEQLLTPKDKLKITLAKGGGMGIQILRLNAH